jgi:hypothetical protein
LPASARQPLFAERELVIWISGLILRGRPASLWAGDKFRIRRLEVIFLCR